MRFVRTRSSAVAVVALVIVGLVATLSAQGSKDNNGNPAILQAVQALQGTVNSLTTTVNSLATAVSSINTTAEPLRCTARLTRATRIQSSPNDATQRKRGTLASAAVRRFSRPPPDVVDASHRRAIEQPEGQLPPTAPKSGMRPI